MKKHRPMAKCNTYSVSFLMQPSKEAGASTTSFGDGRDHGVGNEWVQTLFKVTQSRWRCKDLSRAFQIQFFLLLVPDMCTVSSHTILLKLLLVRRSWYPGLTNTQKWLKGAHKGRKEPGAPTLISVQLPSTYKPSLWPRVVIDLHEQEIIKSL